MKSKVRVGGTSWWQLVWLMLSIAWGPGVYNAVWVRSGNEIWGWVDMGEGSEGGTVVDELALNLARGPGSTMQSG